MSFRIQNNKGMALAEIVVVIAIMGLITATAVSGLGNSVQNARKSTVENDMRLLASNLEVAVNEIGMFEIVEGMTDEEISKLYFRYMRRIEDEYSNTKFSMIGTVDESTGTEEEKSENMVVLEDGFYINTEMKDPWSSTYRLYYRDNAKIGKIFSLLSAGPNGKYDTYGINSTNEKTTKEYDDIVCVISIKDNAFDRDVSFDKFV